MKQLELLNVNPERGPVIPLNREVREELLALMGEAIVTIHSHQVRGENNERHSLPSKDHRRAQES